MYVGTNPLNFVDHNGLGKTKTWTGRGGRKEVAIKCKNFKDAKNKTLENGGGGPFRKKGKLVVECHPCGQRHLHDSSHNNENKPNIHYEF
jgi:hypothetical protein